MARQFKLKLKKGDLSDIIHIHDTGDQEFEKSQYTTSQLPINEFAVRTDMLIMLLKYMRTYDLISVEIEKE